MGPWCSQCCSPDQGVQHLGKDRVASMQSAELAAEEHYAQQQHITLEEQALEEAKIQEQRVRPRRCSVSAQRVSDDMVQDYKKPVHPKDQASIDNIQRTIAENDKMQVILGHLGREPLMDVVNAFYTKDFNEGTDIIRQGDAGDCLYIIADGTVDIFVNRPGADGLLAPGKGSKVVTFGPGALFGELALMYNAPRAATVTAACRVTTWVLNALDFKMLLVQSSQAQYAKYEGWLSEVDLLKTLNHFELAKLADVMQSDCFDSNEDIITQGDQGDKFYIVEDGTAAAFIMGDGGEKLVKQYEKGGYFGEIALLTAEPRRATVRATGEGCSVVYVSKEDFDAVLGPITENLKLHVDQYPQYAQFLQ